MVIELNSLRITTLKCLKIFIFLNLLIGLVEKKIGCFLWAIKKARMSKTLRLTDSGVNGNNAAAVCITKGG